MEHFAFEDSHILDVRESDQELCFEVEAVMTPDHPRWSQPKPGEVHAYLVVDVIFAQPRRIEWVEKRMKPITGPDGEIDYGNIDSFVWRPSWFEIQGEFGHVRVDADPPTVTER